MYNIIYLNVVFHDLFVLFHLQLLSMAKFIMRNHCPLSKRRGSDKNAYLGEMKAWLGSIVDICTSMCAYNMCYSGKLS